MCKGGTKAVREVELKIFINGVSVEDLQTGMIESLTFSPFTIIARVKGSIFPSHLTCHAFKIHSPPPGRCWYFGVPHKEDCKSWTAMLGHGVRLVALSVLPPNSPTAWPLPTIRSTANRLLAGNLLHAQKVPGKVETVYGQLETNDNSGLYRMRVYEDEGCEEEMFTVELDDNSVFQNISCTSGNIFQVGSHYFVCESPAEKKIWMRCLANLKYRVEGDAPAPTLAKLVVFREEIDKTIEELEQSDRPSRPLLEDSDD
eukprot:GHVU01225096.1.p1 GENE.GHVU01225096.1~~GHVU01225096.1.p1  ORF type:complete len:258 (+),score=50.03 GHVU01225096.1:476-1249(+)